MTIVPLPDPTLPDGAGVSTKQIRLQLPAESFDCDVGPTNICWQAVPESWSGGSERTIAQLCACGNTRTGVLGMLIESRVPGSVKNYPIPGSSLPEIIPEVTAKWPTAVCC